MKKLLCLVLCMVFLFSLTACGKEAEQKPTHSIDISYYAKLGQINDLEYKLGDNVEDAKNLLSQTTDDHGESNYFDYESGEYTIMTDGSICLCYKTDDKESGITHIVKYGDAYGFTTGDVSTQVRDILSAVYGTVTERKAQEGELFFLPAGADMTVIYCPVFSDTQVCFVFQEHALSATVISKVLKQKN